MSISPPPRRHAWVRSLGPLTLAELRRRYAGSAFGAVWAVLGPLVEVAAYAAVFGWLLRPATASSGLTYALYIAAGLLPWISLREALEGSASLLPDNRWIRRSRVPLELLVARQVLVAGTRGLVGLALVVAAAFALGLSPGVAGVVLPALGLYLQTATAYGLGLILAPLAALHPDVRPAMGSLLTLLTFASPILYAPATLPAGVASAIDLNPYAHFLVLYRFPLEASHSLLSGSDIAWVLATPVVSVGLATAFGSRLYFPARDRL